MDGTALPARLQAQAEAAQTIELPDPAPAARPRRRPIFFAGLQVYMAALVFAGFGSEFAETPGKALTLAPVIHVHAAIMTLWIVFMVVQGCLPATGRLQLHRTLGWWGAGVAGLVLVTGIMVAGQGVHDGWDPFQLGSGEAFAAIPFRDLAGFTVFLAIGLAARNAAPEAHRRLMTLATLSVIPAGLARLTPLVGPDAIVVLNHAPIAALIAYDLFTRRRVLASTWMGSAALIAMTPLCIAMGRTEAWQDLVRALT